LTAVTQENAGKPSSALVPGRHAPSRPSDFSPARPPPVLGLDLFVSADKMIAHIKAVVVEPMDILLG
jgi:hypothetical protein